MSKDLAKQLRESTHTYQVDCELKMKCADYIEALEAKYPPNWVTAQEYYKKRADKAEAKNAELEAKWREAALSELSALGQASEAYTAQLEAEAKLAKAVEALERITHADAAHWANTKIGEL
jgi:hypothetical protein